VSIKRRFAAQMEKRVRGNPAKKNAAAAADFTPFTYTAARSTRCGRRRLRL